MTVNVGTLVAVLRADVSKFIPEMKKAGNEAKSTAGAISGLSSAVAGFAAAAGGGIFASAASEIAQMAAASQDAIEIFERSGGSIGDMREVTKGLVADAEIAKKGNLADVLGITQNQFKDLAKIAIASAKVTGKSTNEMFERMILGTGKMEKEILEETGIVFKAEDAWKKYAKSIGTTSDKLSDQQKLTVFTNEVIKRGGAIIDKAGLATGKASEGFNRLKASMENLKGEVGAALIPIMGKIGTVVSDVVDAVQRMDPATRAIVTLFAEWAVVGSVVVGGLGALLGAIAGVGAMLPLLMPVALVLIKVTVLIGGLAVAIGLVRKAWVEDWVVMGQPMKDLWENVKTFGSDVFETMSSMSKTTALFIANVFTVIPRTLGAVLSFIGAQIASFMKWVGEQVKMIPKDVQNLMGFDADAFAGQIVKLGTGFQVGIESVENFANEVRDIAADLLDPIGLVKTSVSFWKEVWTENKDAIKQTGAETLAGFIEMVKIGAEGFKETLVDLLGIDLANKVMAAADAGGGKTKPKQPDAPASGKVKAKPLMFDPGTISTQVESAVGMMTSAMADPLVGGFLLLAEKALAGFVMVAESVFGGEFGDTMKSAGGAAITAVLSAVLAPLLILALVIGPIITFLALGPLIVGLLIVLWPVIVAFGALALVIGGVLLPLLLTGFVFGIAQTTKTFENFRFVMEGALTPLKEAAEPLFRSLMPIAGLMVLMAEAVAPIIAMFANWTGVMHIAFGAMQFFAVSILLIAQVAAFATLQFELAGQINQARIDVAAITLEEANAKAASVLATRETTESLRAMNEELLNLDNSPIFRRMAFAATRDPSVRPNRPGRPRGA